MVNRGRFSPVFIGQSHSQVLRRTLRTYRNNIVYNTLPYNFSRMLLLPHVAFYEVADASRVCAEIFHDRVIDIFALGRFNMIVH